MNILHITVRSDIGGGPEHLYQQALSQVNDHGLNIYVALMRNHIMTYIQT